MSNITETLTEKQAVKGLDFPIEVKIREDGTQIVPTVATITVYDESGSELVEDQSMTIDGSTGTLTYTLPAANTSNLEENAVIVIEYSYGGLDYKASFLWDCVINKLKCSVVDDDLKKYFPALADEIWSVQSNYDTQIAEAFKEVIGDIEDKGRRSAMLIDGSQIDKLVVLKTFQNIFFNFTKAGDDIWFIRFEKIEEAYKMRFSKLIIKYDADEDGIIDSDEKSITQGQITFRR